MVGTATPVTRSGGPPAPTMARLMSRIVSAEQALAMGWALKTTALPGRDDADGVVDDGRGGVGDRADGADHAEGRPLGDHHAVVAADTAWTSRSSGPGALVVTSRFLMTLSS